MESTLKSEIERKTQELEKEYQERTAKHESETQMLKKALLEHGRQRVYQALSLSREEGDSANNSSLENSQ